MVEGGMESVGCGGGSGVFAFEKRRRRGGVGAARGSWAASHGESLVVMSSS
jgi:hypothetical protein